MFTKTSLPQIVRITDTGDAPVRVDSGTSSALNRKVIYLSKVTIAVTEIMVANIKIHGRTRRNRARPARRRH